MTRAVTDEVTNMGEQAARAGADISRRSAETARDSLQSGLNTAADSFRSLSDEFTRVLGLSGPQAREVAQRSSENIQAVSQASTVLARGAQEVSREFFGLVQDRLTKNLEAVNRMVGCRSVQDFMAVQSDVARDNLQQVIETNRRVAEVSLRTSGEASKIIQAASNR
jgi:phasin family protein